MLHLRWKNSNDYVTRSQQNLSLFNSLKGNLPPHRCITKNSKKKFDQLRPIIALANTDTQSTEHTVPPQYIPTVAILTHSAVKHIAHKNIMDCFNPTNPHNAQWKYTAFQQYNKNSSYCVFTIPQLICTLPTNTDILKSILATTVKATETKKLWNLGL